MSQLTADTSPVAINHEHSLEHSEYTGFVEKEILGTQFQTPLYSCNDLSETN